MGSKVAPIQSMGPRYPRNRSEESLGGELGRRACEKSFEGDLVGELGGKPWESGDRLGERPREWASG